MISGHSDIPLPMGTIKALDTLTKSVGHTSWYVINQESVVDPDGNRSGFDIHIRFLRSAASPIVGIKPHDE